MLYEAVCFGVPPLLLLIDAYLCIPHRLIFGKNIPHRYTFVSYLTLLRLCATISPALVGEVDENWFRT